MPTLRQALTVAVKRLDAAKLTYGHGTTNPMDEAVFLILEGLGLPIDRLETHLDKPLKPAQDARVRELVDLRINTRKPAPYLVGRAYIQGIPFRVDERTIVPRSFIGELLFGDHLIGRFIPDPDKIKRVVDVCTGSGCLAILAALIFPQAKVDAVDLSREALALAKLNVADKKLQRRVKLHRGNLFAPLKGKTYDLIITNPPYVNASAMQRLPPEYRYEPEMALAGGVDGLDLVRKILKAAPKHLTPDGAIICEIGSGRKVLERDFPHLPFFWLDTEGSEGEVFWLTRAELLRRPNKKKPVKKKISRRK